MATTAAPVADIAPASAAPVDPNAAAAAAAAAAAGAAPNGAPAAAGAAGAAGQTPANPYASASLYVGDLAPDVTESHLYELFNAVGSVASVRVCRDLATRRSLGYAYVNFHRVDDAERALAAMNFSPIHGRPCRIMWSNRDPTLRRSGAGNIFVKNLAPSIDNKTLYDTFSIFGNILSCKVATNPANGESLGYGFVHFDSEEAAKKALVADKKLIADQTIEVAPFKSRTERGVADQKTFTNVYVKNLPEDWDRNKMDSVFSQYGPVNSSVIMIDPNTNKSRGFGFVNFEKPEDAAAAVEALNDSEVSDGKKLYVNRAQKRVERQKDLRRRFEQIKLERQRKFAGVNLYVKNLVETVDDVRLTEEFSKFGSIVSCKVMRTPDGKSRGFGFVCFNTADEATKAVQEMNGKMLEAKPLYVALAQKKEVRQAQLAAQHAQRHKMMGHHAAYLYPSVGQPGALMYGGQAAAFQRQAAFMYPQQMQGVAPRAPWNAAAGRPGAGMNAAAPMGMTQFGYMHMNPMVAAQVAGLTPAAAAAAAAQNAAVAQQMSAAAVVTGAAGRGGRGGQQGGQQVAAGAGRGGAGQQRGGQQGAGRGGGRPGQQHQQQQAANYKYTQQVRNNPQGPSAAQLVAGAPGVAPQLVPVQQQPLTVEALTNAPPEQQKALIGERLYPMIHHHQPQLAGKITGMLLEMDNAELLHLLESQDALLEKIDEAVQVYKDAQSEQQ